MKKFIETSALPTHESFTWHTYTHSKPTTLKTASGLHQTNLEKGDHFGIRQSTSRPDEHRIVTSKNHEMVFPISGLGADRIKAKGKELPEAPESTKTAMADLRKSLTNDVHTWKSLLKTHKLNCVKTAVGQYGDGSSCSATLCPSHTEKDLITAAKKMNWKKLDTVNNKNGSKYHRFGFLKSTARVYIPPPESDKSIVLTLPIGQIK